MGSRIKAIILEQDTNSIRRIQQELKKSDLDFYAEIVQTGEAYEKALCSLNPDIIIAAYPLPVFDGLSAFQCKQKISPQTPLIIVSDPIGEEKAVAFMKMGVTDHVLKEKVHQLTPKVLQALKEAAERKQNDRTARRHRLKRDQASKIMDLCQDVICTLDQEGRFVTVGAASISSWGYLPEELIGRRAIDLVYQEDKQRTYQALHDLANGIDLINFENRYLRKDGRVVTLLWSARWDPQEKLGYLVVRDISAVRMAEEKIKATEKRFRILLQNSSDGYILLAADGTVLERSPTAPRVLGLEEGGRSERFRIDLVHPDDRSAVNEAYIQVRQDPHGFRRLELRFLMPDGTYKWLETTMHNQLQEPAVGALVLNFRDISESKLAEISLRESEARLNEAQAIGHIGYWEENLTNGSVRWSDELYRIYGLDEKVTGPTLDTFRSVIHPDDRAEVLAYFIRKRNLKQNDASSFRILRSSGEVRYVTSEWRFEFDGMEQPMRLFGIVQDITERRLAEAALERSEEKYRKLFNVSPIPMWVYDVETLHFLDVNKAAIQHYGYSKAEFQAMTVKDIRPPEEARNAQEIGKNTAMAYSYTCKQVKKSGEVIDVDIKSNVIDLHGRKAWLVIATDISERMKHTQAIEEQNAILREIAWTQSHVVRAPLARIMGLVNLLKDYPPDKACASEIIALISISAQELDAIIRAIVQKAEKIKKPPH